MEDKTKCPNCLGYGCLPLNPYSVRKRKSLEDIDIGYCHLDEYHCYKVCYGCNGTGFIDWIDGLFELQKNNYDHNLIEEGFNVFRENINYFKEKFSERLERKKCLCACKKNMSEIRVK